VVSDERLVMALLAEGNPATEVAHGASTEVSAATYLATLEQRSSDMTTTEESADTQTPGPGRGLAWAMAAFVVILAVGGLYLAFSGDDGQVVDQTIVPTPSTVPTTVPTPITVFEPAPSEISIARAFFHARNAYDVESATALFNPDAHYHGSFITSVDMYPALFDWLRATGWQWTVDECRMKSGDANTFCTYHVENAWSRAMGLAPPQGTIFFEIWEGGMRAVPDFTVHHTGYFGERGPPNLRLVEVWETVIDWIRANHPTDLEAMVSPDGSAPILDTRSIDLWRTYTQEFVEASTATASPR
jgi:hypothetical protein